MKTREKKIGYISKRSSELWSSCLKRLAKKMPTRKNGLPCPSSWMKCSGGKSVMTYAVVLIPVEEHFMNRYGDVIKIPFYGEYNPRPLRHTPPTINGRRKV